MAVPFGTLIPQRSRVLPQGGAVLGGLTGTFLPAFERGQQQAAQDAAPDLLLNYLDSQGAAYQPTLGRLAPPPGSTTAPRTNAPAYNGMPTQANADQQTALTPGSPTFNGQFALRRENAAQQNPAPVAPYATDLAGYGSGLNTTGLDGQFGPALDSAIQAYIAQGGDPSSVQINSLVRSTEEQARLYDQYQRGEIGLAAPPGQSRHEYGAAADIQDGDFLRWLTANAGQYGLSFLQGDAYNRDPGHVQLAGPSPAGTRAPAIPAGAGAGAGGAAQGYASQPAWTPPTQQERMQLRALMLNPATRDMGFQLAVQRMTPPAPVAPDYGFQEVGGVLYRTDPNTGQAVPVAGSPTAPTNSNIVEVNGQLVDRTTGQVVGDYRTPPTNKPPETRNILMPDGNVYIMGFNEATGQFDQRIGLADPGGQFSVAVGPDGAVQVTQGRQGTAAGATEGQANANIYATRMEAASPLIDQFTTSGQNFWSGLVSGAGVVGNIVLSQIDPQYQQFAQATRDFINASLRRESGAVISPEEFRNAQQQYIPQPGDTPATLEQKRQNRLRQTQAIRQASGPFAGQPGAPTQEAPAAAPNIAPVQVRSLQDYEALPPGTHYLDPDGVERIKQ